MSDQEKINEMIFEILGELVQMTNERDYSSRYAKRLIGYLRQEMDERG